MNRLHRELLRLYAPQAPQAPGGPGADTLATAAIQTAQATEPEPETEPDDASPVDADGRVRALVLALARPADWQVLARVWQGVQADWALPAPAIAVSGDDSLQLWFSVAAPVPAAQAQAFVEALRLRYLGDIPAQRVATLPTLAAGPAGPVRHARWVPARQPGNGQWSAFVAQDLAAAFGDEPWLDLPPNPDGQAKLLARLTSMPLVDFERVLQGLKHAEAMASPLLSAAPALPAKPLPPAAPAAGPLALATAANGPQGDDPGATAASQQARRFLLAVMHNDTLAMALRIDAARALLPCRD